MRSVLSTFRSQRGLAIIGTVLAISVFVAVLFFQIASYLTRATQTRSMASRQLFAQEVFQTAAYLVHDAYLTALRTPSCSPKITISTREFCFPAIAADKSNCLRNPFYSNIPVCFSPNAASPLNGVITAFVPEESLEGHAGFFFPRIHLGFPSAYAQTNQVLPPIPGAFAPVAAPTSVATAQVCENGTPGANRLVCLTMRICLDQANCTGSKVSYFQRIGFPRRL